MFGPADRFPFAAERTYTPPDSGFERLVEFQRILNLDRAVLVQASCHGTDNSAMVDAIRRAPGRFAGVAMIDRSHTDGDLEEMHEAGVRGARLNFVRHLGGAPDLDLFWWTVERIEPLGWHLDLHFDAVDFRKWAYLFDDLPVDFIIDHMGRVDASGGVDQDPFRLLVDIVSTNPRAWVKVSGAERITAMGAPPYDDVVPFARALIAAAPDRVLWGSDWPHPNVRHMPDDGDLVDLLADYAPDDDLRHRIMVDNPARLYDFGSRG